MSIIETYSEEEVKMQRQLVKNLSQNVAGLYAASLKGVEGEQFKDCFREAKEDLRREKYLLWGMLAHNDSEKAAVMAADAFSAFAEVRRDLCLGRETAVDAFYGGESDSAAKAVILTYSALKRLYKPQKRFGDKAAVSYLSREQVEELDSAVKRVGNIVSFIKEQIELLRKQARFAALMEMTGNFYRAMAGGF